jgi:hypothetical protein
MPEILTPRKSTPQAETRQGLRHLVATDLFAFCNQILFAHLGIGNKLEASFHRPLTRHVQTTPYRENLYMLFRGSFKTSILTLGGLLQRILAPEGTPGWRDRPHGPNIRILLKSSTADNAEAMLGALQAHLKNDLLLYLFPEVLGNDPEKLPEHTRSGLTVLRSNTTQIDATIRAVGASTELTSQHYDHGQFDDIVAKENSQSREEREKVSDGMAKIRPLFVPGATRTYIGTHWHYDDYLMRLKQAKARGAPLGYFERRAWVPCAPQHPDGADVPGYGWVRAVFPAWQPIAWLLAERAIMGSSDFAAQYLLDPVAAETAHFRRERLKIEDECPALDSLWIGMTIDPAISTRRSADWAAMAVGGFATNGDLWLLELRRMRRDESQLIADAYTLAGHYPRIMAVGVETTGFQKIYRTLFEMEGRQRGYYLPIVKLERDTNITKAVRIGMLQAPLEAGQLHALRSCQALGDFLDELARFRPDRESAHDDLLDAVADLYQIRGRRAAPRGDEDALDPAVREELDWKARYTRQHPGIDRMGLRIAWQREVARQDQTHLRQTLGIEAPP